MISSVVGMCTKQYIHLLVVCLFELLRHYVWQKFLTIVYITIINQYSKLVIIAKCADFGGLNEVL